MPLETKASQHNTAPLAGDTRRQATGLFKGINFQVWQTVLAWVGLEEDQLLFVEGAEDFDVVTDAVGTTVQIKATEQPITLRNEAVISALRSFWQIKHSNAQRQIRFRFVTMSPIACEDGDPFGQSAAGLSLWAACARNNDLNCAEQLRDFLVSDASISTRLGQPLPDGIPPLLDTLRRVSAQEVLNELIRAISWETGEGGVETAREAVRRRLHAYGESKNLLPRDCDHAIAPVFEHVARVAFREHRGLSREDFRTIFGDATSVTVPKTEFDMLRFQAAALHIPAQTGPVVNLAGLLVEAVQEALPDLPSLCHRRDALTRDHASALRQHQTLFLVGSTGTGKSTQANLVARTVGGDWLWIPFPKGNPAQTEYLLRELARWFQRSGAKRNVVLDDFDLNVPDVATAVRSLAAMCLLVKASGGQAIVTSQKPLPALFFRETAIAEATQKQLPRLTAEEIKEFCCLAGCDNQKSSETWSRLISLHTQGHPQLVHARIAVLARQGWPQPKASEVLETPDEIREERHLARQLLKYLGDGHRELLYRLTLASGSFRRDHAVGFGEVAPCVTQTGDVFDDLVGPWIERVSHVLVQRQMEIWG